MIRKVYLAIWGILFSTVVLAQSSVTPAAGTENITKSQIALIIALVLIAIAIVTFIIVARKYRQIQEQKQSLEDAYEELNQTNEEILSQRDQIEGQRDEIEAQRDELVIQKRIVDEKNDELFNKNSQISDSINYAKRLQNAILAKESDMCKYINCAIFSKPKDIVSGDFYWIHKQWDLVYFAVVDCTGHGVPGALMSLVCNRILDETLDEFKFEDPAMILSNAHTHIIEELGQEVDGYMIRDGMDISLAIYDEEEEELRFAGAHNSAVLISNGIATRIEADNRSVGFTFKKEKYREFTTKTTSINQGDMLYMFTDGYTDQFGGEDGMKFFYHRLEETLLKIWDKPLDQQRAALETTFENWRGNQEQIDDVTIMCVRF